MKKCPFCAEEIQSEAVKCKHCGEDLSAHMVKEQKARQVAKDQQKLLRIIGICLAGFAALLFWYIAIPAIAVWYLFFNRNGKRKMQAALVKARVWNVRLMPYLRKHWKAITPVAAVFVLLIGVRSAFAPEAAAIETSDTYEFVGDSLGVTGKVTADCRCKIQVFVNDIEVALTDDHAFEAFIPMAKDSNTGKVTIIAKATGGFMSKSTMESKVEATYKRKTASIEILNSPLENGDKKYQLILKGIPNAMVSEKNGAAKATLNPQGSGTLMVSFNNDYNVQNVPILLVVNADGYVEGTTTIEVKNLKYDAERVAEEKAIEEKRLAEARAKEQARARMRSNPLEFIEMVDNNWYMGGFGSIPIHAITLKNKGEVSYKDIGIAITYSSKSDTLIDVGAHVIYDVLPAGKTKTFREINMGFMDGQAAKSRVEILSAKIYE